MGEKKIDFEKIRAKTAEFFKELNHTNIKDLIARKPILAFTIPAVFFIILMIPIVLILPGLGKEIPEPTDGPAVAVNGPADPTIAPAVDSAGENGTTIEILPQTERIAPEQDPFGMGTAIGAHEITVVGIITNSNGVSTAIIQGGANSYIVENGDQLGETTWKVTKITDTEATISDGSTEKVLALDKASN